MKKESTAESRALDLFANMMIEKIQSISTDWKKPWFTEGSLGDPCNMSGRRYNGMNALMLLLRMEKNGYQLPVFATFDRIQSLNYGTNKQGVRAQLKDKDGNNLPHVGVNKGEKSFPVFITVFKHVNAETGERISEEDYKALSKEERENFKTYPRMLVYNVFNIEQTNIKEARPKLWKELTQNHIPQKPTAEGELFTHPSVDRMISDSLWLCPIKPTYGDDAYYSISKDEIVIPEKKQFRDGESFYSNLFHEMAHSTGAEKRLNRLKPASFGSNEYAREELVAELTAALVSARQGITKCIKDDSAAYLKSWLGNLKEDANFIKTVLLDVKRASAMIEQRINECELTESAPLS